MKYLDMTSRFRTVESITPATRSAASVNGSAVPLTGYPRVALVHLAMGTMVTNGTLDVHIEWGDADDTWTDLLEEDGATTLAFDQRVESSAEASLVGLLYLTELPATTTQLRAVGVVATANVSYGVSFILGDFPEYPVTGVTNNFADKHGVGAREALKTL